MKQLAEALAIVAKEVDDRHEAMLVQIGSLQARIAVLEKELNGKREGGSEAVRRDNRLLESQADQLCEAIKQKDERIVELESVIDNIRKQVSCHGLGDAIGLVYKVMDCIGNTLIK